MAFLKTNKILCNLHVGYKIIKVILGIYTSLDTALPGSIVRR